MGPLPERPPPSAPWSPLPDGASPLTALAASPLYSGRLGTSQSSPTLTATTFTESSEMASSALTPPEAVDPATETLVAPWCRCLAKAAGDLWTQVGIVSFGSSSGCETGLPAGFTRTEYYIDGIMSETGMSL